MALCSIFIANCDRKMGNNVFEKFFLKQFLFNCLVVNWWKFWIWDNIFLVFYIFRTSRLFRRGDTGQHQTWD